MNRRIFIFLSKYGCDVSELHGATITQEEDYPTYYWALEKKNALKFIELCKEEVTPIIGGEIYYKGDDGSLEYSTNHWRYNRQNQENFTDYLMNSIDKALSCINTVFCGDNILYGFTINEQ